tara:strand:+ start:267 stop:1868 length:1602 start_codon:yes stop_codon:yes gene_type:complete
MEVFDKFFQQNAYKFDKGYPDMDNDQDVLLLESLLSEVIDEKFSLKEANTAEGNKFIEDIIIKNSEKLGFELDELDEKNRLYFKGIPSKGARGQRVELLTLIGSLFPDNEFNNITSKNKTPTFSVVIDGKKHTFTVKGSGSDYSTETYEKEGLVIYFYNSPLTKLLTPDDLLENGESILGKDYYKGLEGKNKDKVKILLDKYLSNIKKASNDKVALDTLNDPLSSAIAIKKGYGNNNPLITGKGTFDDVRATGVELSGIDSPDKWNPGDIYLQLTDIKYNKAKALSDPETIIPITEYNKNFVNVWGETTNIDGEAASFVAISLKKEKSAAGKGKGFLKGFDPAQEYGKIKSKVTSYNVTGEEIELSDDELSNKVTLLKKEVESDIKNKSKNIEYTPGPNPTKRDQLLSKYASLKILNFIFTQISGKGGLEIDKALGSIASYAASLTGVNPTFFKVTGNPKGEATITRYPAESTSELTKDKPIIIIDKPTAGSIQILISMTSLDPKTDSTKNFNYSMNIRSNGGIQNTIELQEL